MEVIVIVINYFLKAIATTLLRALIVIVRKSCLVYIVLQNKDA